MPIPHGKRTGRLPLTGCRAIRRFLETVPDSSGHGQELSVGIIVGLLGVLFCQDKLSESRIAPVVIHTHDGTVSKILYDFLGDIPCQRV